MGDPGDPGDYYDRKRAEAAKLRAEYREAKRVADACEPCGGTGILEQHADADTDWCDDCTEARGRVLLIKQRLEAAEYVGD